MKVFFIILKVITALFLILFGLIALTNLKLSGITIGAFSISSEAVNVFVDTAGDYIFWIYVALVVFLIFRKKIKDK